MESGNGNSGKDIRGDGRGRRLPSPILATVVVALLLVTVSALAIGFYYLLVEPRGGAFDFYWLWQGGRAILAGENPYGTSTTEAIQRGVFGTTLSTTQYQHVYPYPAYAAFVLFPFILVPFPLAVSVWLALQIPMFFLAMMLGMDVLGQRLSPVRAVALAVLAILGFRYPTIALVLGQVTILVLICMISSAWLYKTGHPILAGVSLAVAGIRPDVALIGLFAFVLFSRRLSALTDLIKGFLATTVILVAMPIGLIGFWPVEWLSALSTYATNPNAVWPIASLGSPFLILFVVIILLAWLARYVIAALKAPSPRNTSLAISALILVSLLIVKQTGSYGLTYSLVPAAILITLDPRKKFRVLIASTLLLPWVYFVLHRSSGAIDLLLVPAQFVLLQEIACNLSHSPVVGVVPTSEHT